MHDPEILHGLRNFVWSAAMYGNAAARVASRGHSLPRIHNEGRHIFVVGAPRSGTTFLAGAIAAQPGLVDLGEVQPVKAAIPKLTSLPEPEAASRFRRTLDRVRRLGLSAHLRGVEQTPETAFVLRAVLQAYPEAQTVHIVRDGRDVVCSLLEPDRAEEFVGASDAKRAAWAWRRYVTAARGEDERRLEVRYEDLSVDPRGTAARLARALDLDADVLANALSRAHDRSVGRWRRDLSPEQLAEVEQEAGALLRELGYSGAGFDASVESDAPPVVQHGEDA